MNTGSGKRLVYTAIFGRKDVLRAPRFVLPGWDFICFTDQDISSSIWQIRKVVPPFPDPTRSARMYKILAHRFLTEYEISIWMDGNVQIKGDVTELVEKYLGDANVAVFDHAAWQALSLSSLKEELERLLEMERIGKHQDNADLMQRQFNAYLRDGFPDASGLAWTLVLLRRHNESDVVAAMERWWSELLHWSKRDQMSFNYVAWKTGLRFNYIPLDGADNSYTKRLNHYLSLTQQLRSYVMGAAKRIAHLLGTTNI